MPHSVSLISTIAAGLGLALIFGFLAVRLKLPALVGYLLAGVVIGPFTPGFVADGEIASQLAEIGVMLLMFGVGLHFSLDDLLAVRKIAVPGAVVQMSVATALGMGLAHWWGWSLGGALVFGLSLSVASTVVLLRALEDRKELDTANGRIAVGWLVVEDLAMVLVLVLLPPLGGWLSGQAEADVNMLWKTLGLTLLQVGGFVTLMLVAGRRFFPWVLWQVQRTGSRELFTLCVVAAAVSIAYGSTVLFGVSFALGAFFAGMVMRESEFSHRAAEESLPLRDAFAVLFFVSVGMLFDPWVLLERPLQVLAVVAIIIMGKSLAAGLLVMAFRYPLNTALTVSASLAQIGEFSFILIGMGASLGLLPPEGQSLVLAGALVSIALNQLVFSSVDPVQRWLLARSAWVRQLEARRDVTSALPALTEDRYLAQQVVLVGYGRVGQHMAKLLMQSQVPVVVVEQNREAVERLRRDGVAAVAGDAADPEVLVQAHIATARMLVITTPDTLDVRQMMATARALNPHIKIGLRAHSKAEAQLLAVEDEDQPKDQRVVVFLSEHELARAMVQHVLVHTEPVTALAHQAGVP